MIRTCTLIRKFVPGDGVDGPFAIAGEFPEDPERPDVLGMPGGEFVPIAVDDDLELDLAVTDEGLGLGRAGRG